MRQDDAINGKSGTGYVTIDGNRYELIQIKNFETDMELEIASFYTLGSLIKKHKVTGMEGKWSGTIFYGTPIFKELVLEFKSTGYFPPIEFQIVNDDPASAAGRQTIVYKHCLPDSVALSKMDLDSEILEEDLSGTFDDFDIPEKFKTLKEMM